MSTFITFRASGCEATVAEFQGYRRSDGTVGVRNHVLVLPTVVCSTGLVERLDREQTGRYALVTHQHGCGQVGADHELTVRTLAGFATSPNVGAVVLVSLGCESNQPEVIAKQVEATGRPIEIVSIQEAGGLSAAYERVVDVAAAFRNRLEAQRRESVPVSELLVGLECGGSDAWSGLTANPALGNAADSLVAEGATVMLGETPEVIGAEHLLAARARSPEVADALLRAVADWEAHARRTGADARGAQPSPGNIEGGITTLEEKSFGALQKGGSTPLNEVVEIARPPTQRGLVLMDTSGDDIEQATAFAAGGAHLVCFTTGRGTPTGSPIMPVIKISSNSRIADWMGEHIDLDAGPIASGAKTLSEVGDEILERVLAVASGETTAAERGLHREFGITRLWSTL
jgi:altronate dehydratase large subunit